MGTYTWLLVGMGGLAGWCVFILARRNRGKSTENIEGLLIEQDATKRAQQIRNDVRAFNMNPGSGRGFGSDERRR
ncbi:hypothetical protein [Streptomyces sp. BE147]|uniref:hypothetical protein n=1 Tax=unclassified Streptomyces TaxID=2593676 RepID=UPI002E75E2C4|nr:hypothetical protein [Streptomyces sp. BE147]MEE1737166.1 hypothetical protein [Streptomyces sp. BE147]